MKPSFQQESNTYRSYTCSIPDVAILDKSVIWFSCRRLRRKKRVIKFDIVDTEIKLSSIIYYKSPPYSDHSLLQTITTFVCLTNLIMTRLWLLYYENDRKLFKSFLTPLFVHLKLFYSLPVKDIINIPRLDSFPRMTMK